MDFQPVPITEIPMSDVPNNGAGGNAPPVTTSDTTPGTHTWPSFPSGKDITVGLWSPAGGGGAGNSTDGGACGGGGAMVFVKIPAAVSAAGGTYTIGAVGTGGVHSGSASTAGGVTKITLNSVDVVSLTGGGGGGVTGSGPATGGNITVDSSVTLLASYEGLDAPTIALQVNGQAGVPGVGPAAGNGGTAGTGAGNGGNGSAFGGSGGGGGATGNGGNGGGGGIQWMWSAG